jgi:hypothetical protein
MMAGVEMSVVLEINDWAGGMFILFFGGVIFSKK